MNERAALEDLALNGKVMLQYISTKQDGRV
jgi:hypothetical protein